MSLLHLRDGFLTGCFQPNFIVVDYFIDLLVIGDDYGIDDIEDIDWDDEFEGFMPFALLDSPDEEDLDLLGAFLVVQTSNAKCPVFVWEREGWMLYPLASSLDDFIAGKKWRGAAPDHDNMGLPYKKYAWVDEVPDDDDDDD